MRCSTSHASDSASPPVEFVNALMSWKPSWETRVFRAESSAHRAELPQIFAEFCEFSHDLQRGTDLGKLRES
jgi:hypothetical protein